jgi:hypothetical protein
MTDDVVISTRSFHDAAVDLAKHFGCSVEWIELRGAWSVDYMPVNESRASVKDRHIEAVLPRSASDFAVFCHELGHVVMTDCDKADEPESWRELRASRFALEAIKRLGYGSDVVERAGYRLGRALAGYLQSDLEAGAVTRAEIAVRVPAELSAYIDRVGMRSDSALPAIDVSNPPVLFWGPPV